MTARRRRQRSEANRAGRDLSTRLGNSGSRTPPFNQVGDEGRLCANTRQHRRRTQAMNEGHDEVRGIGPEDVHLALVRRERSLHRDGLPLAARGTACRRRWSLLRGPGGALSIALDLRTASPSTTGRLRRALDPAGMIGRPPSSRASGGGRRDSSSNRGRLGSKVDSREGAAQTQILARSPRWATAHADAWRRSSTHTRRLWRRGHSAPVRRRRFHHRGGGCRGRLGTGVRDQIKERARLRERRTYKYRRHPHRGEPGRHRPLRRSSCSRSG